MKKRKLILKREDILVMASRELSRAVGGAAPSPTAGVGCTNTALVCVDTEEVSNCNCSPSGFCPSVTCAPRPF
jgi:hypothetical protein